MIFMLGTHFLLKTEAKYSSKYRGNLFTGKGTNIWNFLADCSNLQNYCNLQTKSKTNYQSGIFPSTAFLLILFFIPLLCNHLQPHDCWIVAIIVLHSVHLPVFFFFFFHIFTALDKLLLGCKTDRSWNHRQKLCIGI